MPRKPYGTAVDKRNGARLEVNVSRVEKFPLPKKTPAWDPETKRAWNALWDDTALTGMLVGVDRPVLLRWADAIDRYTRHLRMGDADPIGQGSMGQDIESPHYGIADKALRIAKECEAQLGVGALHRARLGIAVLTEQRSLVDLNTAFMASVDEDDPRLGY